VQVFRNGYTFNSLDATIKFDNDFTVLVKGKLKNITQNLFVELDKAYEKIVYKVTQCGCKELPVLDKITIDLSLSFILVDDRELGYGMMYMATAFQYLASIQSKY
jgi:hypothetical protein